MKVKNKTILILTILITICSNGQENRSNTSLKNNLIVNFINPSLEYELVVGKRSILSSSLGVGYNGAYNELTISNDGFNYIIAPFVDFQYKFMYNRKRREKLNKTLSNNSGNFISLRAITRGWSIAENVTRSDDFDFAVGPTWGFQRTWTNNIRLLMDIGPQYYFDSKGNSGFFPFMIQINIGYNLTK